MLLPKRALEGEASSWEQMRVANILCIDEDTNAVAVCQAYAGKYEMCVSNPGLSTKTRITNSTL